MSYNGSVASPDLERQIELLKVFPEIASKHFRPAMDRSTTAMMTAIGSNITFHDRSGHARSELSKKVTGKGLNMTGRAGWFGNIVSWYVNILEYGARPHSIGYVPALKVRIDDHPGLPPGRFVLRARQETQGEVESYMLAAANATLADLEVK